jgi:hypothetical protein
VAGRERAVPTERQILHNIKDHIEAALAIFRDGKAVGGAKERLLAHIIAEEQGNLAWLRAALPGATGERQRVLQLAIEHSILLMDLIQQKEIAADLAIELLDHFLEEHVEGFLDGEASPTGPSGNVPAVTVGSLFGQPQ